MIERALALTIDYVKQRQAFGKKIIEFQNTQFKLAECKTRGDRRASVFVDHCIGLHVKGELDTVDRLDGQILDHRSATARSSTAACNCSAATAIMDEYPIARHVPRRPRAAHLRRHQRDHEAAHCQEFLGVAAASARFVRASAAAWIAARTR